MTRKVGNLTETIIGKQAMVEGLQEYLPNYNKYEIQDFVSAWDLFMQNSLLQGHTLRFLGVADIAVFFPPDRLFRNVYTKELKVQPQRPRIKVRQSKTFQEKLNLLKAILEDTQFTKETDGKPTEPKESQGNT